MGFGVVRYIDNKEIRELLRTTGPHSDNVVPTFNKRLSFKHEQEIRMAIGIKDSSQQPRFLRMRVEINKMIDRVYVSPTAEPWIANVVRRAAERYGIEKEVIQSSLLSVKLE